jgi:hypothetical protein
MNRLTVTVRAWRDGAERVFEVRGQTAKALLALVEAGQRGVTALECAARMFRVEPHCHELRHRYGLDIATQRETHPGGWHGRHVLLSAVQVIRIERESAVV